MQLSNFQYAFRYKVVHVIVSGYCKCIGEIFETGTFIRYSLSVQLTNQDVNLKVYKTIGIT